MSDIEWFHRLRGNNSMSMVPEVPESINSMSNGSIEFVELSFHVSSSTPMGHSFALQVDLDSEGNNSSSTLNMTVEVLVESFESNNLFNLNRMLSGDANWSVDSEEYYDGSYSARSGSMGVENSTVSTLEIVMDIVEEGSISFET